MDSLAEVSAQLKRSEERREQAALVRAMHRAMPQTPLERAAAVVESLGLPVGHRGHVLRAMAMVPSHAQVICGLSPQGASDYVNCLLEDAGLILPSMDF